MFWTFQTCIYSFIVFINLFIIDVLFISELFVYFFLHHRKIQFYVSVTEVAGNKEMMHSELWQLHS